MKTKPLFCCLLALLASTAFTSSRASAQGVDPLPSWTPKPHTGIGH
jgi:hypothetical protein